MGYTNFILFIAGLLFPVTFISMEVGRRLGLKRMAKDPEGVRAGTGAVEGAVFALFGLLIAFTFTSAASRYETRRDLMVQHTTPSARLRRAWTCCPQRSSRRCGRISVFMWMGLSKFTRRPGTRRPSLRRWHTWGNCRMKSGSWQRQPPPGMAAPKWPPWCCRH